LATDQSVAPSALIVAAMSAGINQARDSWPGYGQGWEAYGKRYGATLALNASTDMFGNISASRRAAPMTRGIMSWLMAPSPRKSVTHSKALWSLAPMLAAGPLMSAAYSGHWGSRPG